LLTITITITTTNAVSFLCHVNTSIETFAIMLADPMHSSSCIKSCGYCQYDSHISHT